MKAEQISFLLRKYEGVVGYIWQWDKISLPNKWFKPKSYFSYNINYCVSWLLALMQHLDDFMAKKVGDMLHLSITIPGRLLQFQMCCLGSKQRDMQEWACHRL